MVLESNTVSEVRLPEWAGVGEGDAGDGQVKLLMGGMVVVADTDTLRVFQARARCHRFRVWVVDWAAGNLGSSPHIAIRNGH